MARTPHAAAAGAALDAVLRQSTGMGPDTTQPLLDALMDMVEINDRLDAALVAGGPIQSAVTTLLTRTAAIKAKTDNLP